MKMTDNVYKILTQPVRIRGKIRKVEAEIEGLRLSVLPGAMRYDKDTVQGGKTEDQMSEFIVKLEDLEKKLHSLKTQYVDAQNAVVMLADQLDDPEDVIITLRFISGKEFSIIADEIGMSERQMYRHYKTAQETLNKIVGDIEVIA